MSGLFHKNLLKLDFDTSEESRYVLLVSQTTDTDLSPTEIFALEDAEKFRATAVYFRHFSDNRSPVPQIYIYNNTQNNLNESDLANIHRDLWSNSRIPVFIVVEKTDVKIFDTRKPVEVEDGEIKTKHFDTIDLTADAVKLYSRKLFDSGIFWESEKAKGHFLESTSAYRDLLRNLKNVRADFLDATNLPDKTANKLLVFSILIKYLEERGNEDESLFAKDFFQKLGAEDFCDALRKGKFVELFEKLSRHFNGRIFELSDESEKNLVAEANLSKLADFLDADKNLETGQPSFWRHYSFNHLPVELISTIYEYFLNERDDAVYTPEFLVNALIDEAMPQSEYENLSVKTIDISCGSGIFLVSAFKRLAQRHRYAKFKESGELKTLKSDELLQIIKDCIFGVDYEEDAVRLTVFSLCLAVCDELTPKEFWTELKFNETFKTNFENTNFFDYLENNQEKLGTFDLVIGNPPFIHKIPLSENAEGVYEYTDKNSRKSVNLNKEVTDKIKKKVFPQNQLALMFLNQAPYLLKDDGLLCLIMPAAPLLYNNSSEFRKNFFPEYQVSKIWDFTNLDLFVADVPTAAIFARKQFPDESQVISHIVFRKTKSIEQKIYFEVDKYDFHYVSQQSASNNKHIWKCNLLGGGRLNLLISRLAEINSINHYIRKKNWISNEGYIVGTSNNKNRKSAEFITGKPMLPTGAFKEDYIDESKITPELSKKFHSTGDEKIYHPPHILIKENMGKEKIPTYFSDKYLTFKDSIVGISAPKSERAELFKLYKSFEDNKKLYKLFITTTSNEFAVGRATTILKQDLMNLPYSVNEEEMRLSFVEQILCDDVLDYQIELLAKGSKAEVNNNAIIKDLKKYGEVFAKLLNSVYGKSGKCFFLKKIYDLNNFYITEFNYGENSSEVEVEKRDDPTEHIKSLAENAYSSNISIIRVLKLYERNKIYFIKPKSLRYWLCSVAIKDADEAFSDSIRAGY